MTRPFSERLSNESIRGILERYSGPESDPVPRPKGRLAAVALVLRAGAGPVELLIIRRAAHENDPWSGHMALPGGRRDRSDPSLLHTAVRETSEEVGIDLLRTGTHLGRLEAAVPAGKSLPPLTIVPFVFGVPEGTRARIASPEVAALHWVPLDHLQDNKNQIRFMFRRDGNALAFPAIDVAGEPVWGLTHRIVTDFLRRVASLED